MRCRDETVATADEQRIAEHPAQPAEGATGRRLRQIQTVASRRDVACREQCLEQRQQVEVDIPQIT
jgi:hypothetical protein